MTNIEMADALEEFRREIMQECSTKAHALDLAKRLKAFCEENNVTNDILHKVLDGAGECLWMMETMPDSE